MSLLLLFKGGGSPTQNLDPARVDNSNTFYGPTVTQGTTLLPARYDNANAFYSPTVTPGAVTLTPARYDNAQAFYAPTVARGTVTLLPGLYENTQAFYSPIVTQAGGTQFLLPSLFVNSNQFFAAVVTQQNQPVLPISDVGAEDGKRRKRQKKRDRTFEEEKRRQEELREQILRAVEPVTQSAKPVVVAQEDDSVEIVRSYGAPIKIDVPGFDAAVIARQVASVLEAARVEATMVRQRQEAVAALAELNARIQKKLKQRRDDELLLLMD